MSVKYNREQIIGALNEKGVNQPCHRCGNKTFALIDGFSKYHLSDNTKENVLGGTGVPVVLVGCNNCGAITPHAAVALVKPEEEEIEEEEKEGSENGK